MVTRPASMASAGPVIKVLARLLLCRGPELNRRHMVLQVMSRAIREIAPQLVRDDTWLPAKANGSTTGTASRHFRPLARRRATRVTGDVALTAVSASTRKLSGAIGATQSISELIIPRPRHGADEHEAEALDETARCARQPLAHRQHVRPAGRRRLDHGANDGSKGAATR